MPAFKSNIAEESLAIAHTILSKRDDFKLPKGLGHTNTLCWCFLTSITKLCEGFYTLLQTGNNLSANAVKRSIIEQIVDQYLIGIEKDQNQNKRFMGYHKLLLYFNRRFIQTMKEKIPEIEENYRKQVLSEYQHIIDKLDGTALIEWSEVDEKMGKTYKKSWSGLDFSSRVHKIIKYMKKNKFFHTKMGQYNHPALFDVCEYAFKVNCFYIHPTVYGVAPHFSPPDEQFEWEWNTSHETLHDEANFIFVAIEAACVGISIPLPKPERKMVADLYKKQFGKSLAIKDWLKELKHDSE